MEGKKLTDRLKKLSEQFGKVAPPGASAVGASAPQPPDFGSQVQSRTQSTAPIGGPRKQSAPKPSVPSLASAHMTPPSPVAPPAPPSIDKNALRAQLETAIGNIGNGTNLQAATQELLTKLGVTPADAAEAAAHMKEIEADIEKLKASLNAPSVTDEERDAIVQALMHPSQTIQAPNTPAVQNAQEILSRINEKLYGIRTPPSLKGYGPLMISRPVVEVGGSILEGGLATLIVARVIQVLTGVSITATMLGWLATWTTAAIGWNIGVHSRFKAEGLQEVANEGKFRGLRNLFKDPKKGVLSSRLVTTPLRIGSMALMLGGGVSMIQYVFGSVDDSARHAQLLSEPLLKEKAEVEEFKTRMLKFAPIIPKILNIAETVEAGKGAAPIAAQTPVSEQESATTAELDAAQKELAEAKQKLEASYKDKTRGSTAKAKEIVAAAELKVENLTKGQKGPAKKVQSAEGGGNKGEKYSQAEKDKMKTELISLFQAAGLDPALLRDLKFEDPKDLGQGPIFEFKRALNTGDTTGMRELKADDFARLHALFPEAKNTAELVTAIRQHMGLAPGMTFEQRISDIIKSFLDSNELTIMFSNLDRALEISARVNAQGNDVVGTSRLAMIEGVPPLSVAEVLPYTQAIIDGKEQLRKTMHEKVAEPINQMFSTLAQALGQIGGTVQLVQMPETTLNTQPLENLQELINKMMSSAAATIAQDKATESSIRATLLRFVPGAPGSQKAKGMERYVARMMAEHLGGYRVAVHGDETDLYQRKQAGEGQLFSAGIANVWDTYLWKQDHIANAREAFPKTTLDDVSKVKDAELGQLFRDSIKKWEQILESEQREQDPQVASVLSSYKSLLGKSDAAIGALIREQSVAQLKAERAPIIYAPTVWDLILKGTPPPKLAINFAGWAQEAHDADPAFGASMLPVISQDDDATVGKLVRAHVTTIVKQLEQKKQAGEQGLVDEMIAKYKPMAATPDEQLSSLGARARTQIAYEIEKNVSPIVIYPDSEWEVLLNPALANAVTQEIDPALWDKLPPEKSKQVFAGYESRAEWQAELFAISPVLLLSLGSFLFSVIAVRRKNANLLKVKDKNLEAWKGVEANMLDAISDFNAILAKLPFFSQLPPLDPYMLRAALRQLGESYERDLKQDLTAGEEFKSHLRATFAPGPYAEPIAEIFAMERLTERLASDKEAQRKLADIIAPGFSEVLSLVEKTTRTPAGTDPLNDFLVFSETLDLNGAEIFRNAARGHLRFRTNVMRARFIWNERAQEALVKSAPMAELRLQLGTPRKVEDLKPDTLSPEADALLNQLASLNAESFQIDEENQVYGEILEQLDTAALAEETLRRYKQPHGRRAEIAELAEVEKDIPVPDASELKELSMTAGIKDDVDATLAEARAGERFPDVTLALKRAYEQSHPGEQCELHVSIDENGELKLIATITGQNGSRDVKCPASIFATWRTDKQNTIEAFNAVLESGV